MTISIIANFKAKSDQKETLEALLKSVIELTLQEEGCLKYELYISENDSSGYFGHFYFPCFKHWLVGTS
ncbi:putative quinol monooxygenase [Methylophaga sp.]|uniref:putative quinol monooxygenase n=1 Tax=Methylophaga sp. TaxID=2024840 RepID=UPI003F6E8087